MKRTATAFLASLFFFLLGDALWITVIANDFYQGALAPLLRPQPMLVPAALFYPLYMTGLFIFAIRPGLARQSWRHTASQAALLGLVAYGTYDLSNLSTLRGWPIGITVIDMIWGCVISAGSAIIGYLAARRVQA